MDKFVVLDLETTGVDLERSHILQCSMILASGFDRSTYDMYIRPPVGADIPAGATAVHGITIEDFNNKKFKNCIDYYPSGISDIYGKFIDYYDENIMFVGHNINKFDLPLLINNFKNVLDKEIDIRSINVIDTGMIYLANAFKMQRKRCELEYDFYNRVFNECARKSKWSLSHCLGSEYTNIYTSGIKHNAVYDTQLCYYLFSDMVDNGIVQSVLGGRYERVRIYRDRCGLSRDWNSSSEAGRAQDSADKVDDNTQQSAG